MPPRVVRPVRWTGGMGWAGRPRMPVPVCGAEIRLDTMLLHFIPTPPPPARKFSSGNFGQDPLTASHTLPMGTFRVMKTSRLARKKIGCKGENLFPRGWVSATTAPVRLSRSALCGSRVSVGQVQLGVGGLGPVLGPEEPLGWARCPSERPPPPPRRWSGLSRWRSGKKC